MKPDVDLIICLASGFGTKVYARSGIRRLYRYCRSFATPQTEIIYDEYNGGWAGTARRLHQVATHDTRCVFIAHSWGCGVAFRQFSKAWAKLDRVIELAILIDPVPRPFKILFPLNVFAVTHWGKFRVRNCREVMAFHQFNDRPCGHHVVNNRAATISQKVFSSPATLDKYAPWAVGGSRIEDDLIKHNSIDDDDRVHGDIKDMLDSKIEAWRHGR